MRAYDGGTPKQVAFDREFAKTPNATARELAFRAGVSVPYACNLIKVRQIMLRASTMRGEQKQLPLPEIPKALPEECNRKITSPGHADELAKVEPEDYEFNFNSLGSEVTDLEPVVQGNVHVVEQRRSYIRALDRKFICGEGLTGNWEDRDLVALFDGISSTVSAQLRALLDARSQKEWEIRAREIVLQAGFIKSYVPGLARRGIYRGLRGDVYFTRIAAWIRKRVEAGPLG